MNTKTQTKSKIDSKQKVHVSGAEAVVKCLLEEGADLIYGYPGGAIMPVYDELYKYQDKINHVLNSP